MSLIYHFNTPDKPSLKEVGGKALSLIEMTRAGFAVPAGMVLTVDFFRSWLKSIRGNSLWQEIIHSSNQSMIERCRELKAFCSQLVWDTSRDGALANALREIDGSGPASLFAVRSSSPQEDLESASFAGGYETILGVKEQDLVAAVRRAFASALDERVFRYKKEHGFSIDTPEIAVIIQQQIPSDTSGVSFSLNPLNNCYDECVINANHGLGESVVAGVTTPDTFIVDKINHRILSEKPGIKDVTVVLGKEGGTETIRKEKNQAACLLPSQIKEIAELTTMVEMHYRKPVDIEWAYADGILYLLQARPITTHIPLPPQMITEPGQSRRLYMDFTLIGQGIEKPFSVLGMEFFEIIQMDFMQALLGVDVVGLENSLFGNIEGRCFLNVSNLLKIPKGDSLLLKIGRNDKLVSDISYNLDKRKYVARKLPVKLKGFLFKALKNSLAFLKTAKVACKDPEFYRQKMLDEKKKISVDLEELLLDNSVDIKEFVQKIVKWSTDFINNHSLKLTTASHSIALAGIQKMFKKKDEKILTALNHLERGLPDNVTIEMGLAMYRLSRFKEIRECADGREFEDRLNAGHVTDDFLEQWKNFRENYGFRCPKELDVATERPYENPSQVFNKLSYMALNEDVNNNAESVFKQAWKKREEAYEFLLSRLKGKKAEQFKQLYKVWVAFGGYREIHKYLMIKLIDGLRRKILPVAETLFKSHRLDSVKQVFDLTFKQIEQALRDESIDLRRLSAENTAFRRKTSYVKEFPAFIDSRGMIIRPPRPEIKEGELSGEPISAGVVTGRIKVLRSPDEKPLLPGEILVARATDPGWTTLFVNAGGIILEVGGMMQHGAVVAREYGKPCIAGIEKATSVLKDGQLVEMDGIQGIIRLMEKG
ncbi:MAG: hypothetical protein JW969_11625 [Spirochaetales bacterium]|nr:hypothetical protein [Spirochaetales bacterium]